VPPPQTPPEQVSVPQHWEDELHDAPWPLQPEPPPLQTPPEQVEVPQHCEELVQWVPGPWHEPPVQTLFELQVSTPQQSPLVLQRWLRSWHGPVRSGGTGSGSLLPPQARERRRGAASSASRSLMVVFYLNLN
jgi:hypothetical protein